MIDRAISWDKIKTLIRAIMKESWDVCWGLYKILVPALIITKLLDLAGIIKHIGTLLDPLMSLVGLPGTMGLVWATGLFGGAYAALAVFLNLLPTTPLTVAQTTVMLAILLTAHSLLVEVTIASRAGVRPYVVVLVRMGTALVYGSILSRIYDAFNLLQTPNRNNMIPSPSVTLLGWAQDQLVFLVKLFFLLVGLIILMKLIDWLGITRFLIRLLNPVLRLIGIGERAIPITVLGIVMGLSFGGGIIASEAKSGKIAPRDVFFSLLLMSLFHAVIEDTVAVTLFGAHISGILWGRLIFTFLVMFLLRLAVNALPEPAFNKYLFKAAA